MEEKRSKSKVYCKFPHTVADLGSGTYYVIFTNTSYTDPYDLNQSIPELRLEWFDSEEDWKNEISRLSNENSFYKRDFKPAIVTIPKIKTTITMEME